MKQAVVLALLLLFAVFPLQAQQQLIACETKLDMRASSPQDQDFILLSENGRSGKCFRISCPAGRKSILFHPWTQPRLKVTSASAPVRVTVWVKGSGSGNFGFLTYAADSKIFYPAGTSRKFAVESPAQWQQLEILFTPEAGSEYANRIFSLLPFLSITDGASLWFDDLETEVMSPSARIRIEE